MKLMTPLNCYNGVLRPGSMRLLVTQSMQESVPSSRIDPQEVLKPMILGCYMHLVAFVVKLSPFSGQICIVHVTQALSVYLEQQQALSIEGNNWSCPKMGHRVISMCLAKWFSHDFPTIFPWTVAINWGITMVSNTLGGRSSSLGVSERGCSGLAGELFFTLSRGKAMGNALFGTWSAWEKTHVWSFFMGKNMGEKHMYDIWV